MKQDARIKPEINLITRPYISLKTGKEIKGRIRYYDCDLEVSKKEYSKRLKQLMSENIIID